LRPLAGWAGAHAAALPAAARQPPPRRRADRRWCAEAQVVGANHVGATDTRAGCVPERAVGYWHFRRREAWQVPAPPVPGRKRAGVRRRGGVPRVGAPGAAPAAAAVRAALGELADRWIGR